MKEGASLALPEDEIISRSLKDLHLSRDNEEESSSRETPRGLCNSDITNIT